MKIVNIILISTLVVSILSCSSKLFKEKTPPGTTHYKENIFVDQTEVRNIDWLEYVYWTKKRPGEDSVNYKAVLPKKYLHDNKYEFDIEEQYLNISGHREYPIVGITYEQATAYCKWRSDRVNEYIHIQKGLIESNKEQKYENVPEYVRYRLPNKIEFKELASYPYSNKVLKTMAKEESRSMNSDQKLKITGNALKSIPTNPVFAYWPNEKGLYNIHGNVAEMVQEKGIAMGGSWKDQKHIIMLGKESKYEKAELWLGFRCVCEQKLPIED